MTSVLHESKKCDQTLMRESVVLSHRCAGRIFYFYAKGTSLLNFNFLRRRRNFRFPALDFSVVISHRPTGYRINVRTHFLFSCKMRDRTLSNFLRRERNLKCPALFFVRFSVVILFQPTGYRINVGAHFRLSCKTNVTSYLLLFETRKKL